jgi:hypothetical protein
MMNDGTNWRKVAVLADEETIRTGAMEDCLASAIGSSFALNLMNVGGHAEKGKEEEKKRKTEKKQNMNMNVKREKIMKLLQMNRRKKRKE